MLRALIFLSLFLVPSLAWSQVLPNPPVIGDISCGVSTGETIVATTSAEFTQALTDAKNHNLANGTTIKLTAGATFTGPFIVPVRSSNGCITIRTTAADADLPAAGARITPAYAAFIPKIVSPGLNQIPLSFAYGSHHIKLIGLEFSTANATIGQGNPLVTIGDNLMTTEADFPRNIELDRVYVHGWPTVFQGHGIVITGVGVTVKNSYISDIKQVGADNQAIVMLQGGKVRIVNNYLEASCENIMIGGGDPSVATSEAYRIPSDIEILNNSFFKPLKWKPDDPTYAGINWNVKNLIEFKNARRVLIDGNLFEHNWPPHQSGTAILLASPRPGQAKSYYDTHPGFIPYATYPDVLVGDITFTNNIVRHAGHGVGISGENGGNDQAPSMHGSRFLIKNNLFYDLGGAAWANGSAVASMGQWIGGISNNPSNVTIEHNTAFFPDRGMALTPTVCATTPSVCTGFILRNNIGFMNPHPFIIASDGFAGGVASVQGHYPTNNSVTKNVLIGGPASGFNLTYMNANYGGGNFFPLTIADVGFTNVSIDDYSLQASSPYHNAATDGTDIGIDKVALDAAQALSSGPAPPTDTTPAVLTTSFPTLDLPAGTTQTTFVITANEAATVKWGTSNVVYASLPNTATANGLTHTATKTGLTDGSTTLIYGGAQDPALNITPTALLVTIHVAASTPSPVIPGTVLGLAGTSLASGLGITYTWTAEVDSSKYQLYLCTPTLCSPTVPAGGTPVTTTVTVTGLLNNTVYAACVKGISATNNFSAACSSTVEVTTVAEPVLPGPPAAPTGLGVRASHPSQAFFGTFLWAKNTETDLAGYRIYPRLGVNLYGPAIKELTPAIAYAEQHPLEQWNFVFPQSGTWCFAITSFRLSGEESPKGTEYCVSGVGMTARAARQ